MVKNKILFLDLETTGIDPYSNSIIQIAAEYHINGEKKNEFFAEVRPPQTQEKVINLEALKVTKSSLIQILTSGESEDKVLVSFVDWLLDLNTEKLHICGHNVHFDIAFIRSLFKKYNLDGWDSIVSHRVEDTCALARSLQKAGILPDSSVSLGKLAELLNIAVPANESLHNAKTDVKVTASIYYSLINKLKSMTGAQQ